MTSLEGWSSTIELHPLVIVHRTWSAPDSFLLAPRAGSFSWASAPHLSQARLCAGLHQPIRHAGSSTKLKSAFTTLPMGSLEAASRSSVSRVKCPVIHKPLVSGLRVTLVMTLWPFISSDLSVTLKLIDSADMLLPPRTDPSLSTYPPPADTQLGSPCPRAQPPSSPDSAAQNSSGLADIAHCSNAAGGG
jgi:hypothetical protein